MKKKLIIIFVVIIVLVSLGFIVAGKVRSMKPEKKPDRIEIVRRGPFVVRLKESGNLDSLIKVEVRSNVEGEIEKLFVDEGDDVVKGQQLLKIDEKQIREEYNQAVANYDAAKAEMERARENVTLSTEKLKSDIQLAESSLKAAGANLQSLKASSVQQISQAELSIVSLENLLEQDKFTLKKADLTLEQALSSEKSTKARLDNAKSELDRKQELYNRKFVPLKEVENAQLEYASAQSQYESAQKTVESQRESVASQKKIIESRETNIKTEKENQVVLKQNLEEQEKQAKIQVDQAQERLDILKKNEEGENRVTELAKKSAEANLVRAQSMLNKAKERLGWTTIIAPMMGRVVQCSVEEGEIVISGRSAWSQIPAIMTIADLSKMIVKTRIHELDISKVKVGQKVDIKVDSYPDDVFEGIVKEISPSAQLSENNIIKFEVIIMVTKASKPLLPGMTAYVDIIAGERDNIHQLPLEAVIYKETIKIKTDIKKEMLDKLRDKKVEIVISSYPDKKFTGKVAKIAPEKPEQLTTEVTIIMDGMPKELQPGISSTADIILSEKEKISGIEARIESEKEYYARLVKETISTGEGTGTKDEEVLIKVGERNQSSIEIVDGLKEGDKVKVVPVGEEKEKKK